MATDTDRKPVLLTVDDDPGVSRAVARDLRRQYGEAYRVVRTESGPQALDTLRERYGLGDPVTVRYWRWIQSVARGEFGFSLLYERPVGPLLRDEAVERAFLLARLADRRDVAPRRCRLMLRHRLRRPHAAHHRQQIAIGFSS